MKEVEQIYRLLLVLSKIDSKPLDDYILENIKPLQPLPDISVLVEMSRRTVSGMKCIDESLEFTRI